MWMENNETHLSDFKGKLCNIPRPKTKIDLHFTFTWKSIYKKLVFSTVIVSF